MYRYAVLLLVVALANSNAVAAIVQFSPDGAPPCRLCSATFEVTIIPEVEGGFDTADIVFGTGRPIRMVDFTYSDEWRAAFDVVPEPTAPGFYRNDLWISGNNPTLIDLPSIYAGTLTVEETWILDEYTFGVDAAVDSISCLGQRGMPDFARGRVWEYVPPEEPPGDPPIEPEPTTLGLLAMASLAMLRRPTRRI